MKKLIILSLILLFSCGKDSSVNTKYHPNDWGPGNNWTGDINYNNFYNGINNGSWFELDPYWTTYQRYSFYYTRYNCSNYLSLISFCSYNTVGQGGKEFFNVFSKVVNESRHPFGSTYQELYANFKTWLTPFGPTWNSYEKVPMGVAENGLQYWIFQNANGSRFGINPNYPIWANPVFQEEVLDDGTTVGYYLSYWLYW